MSPISPIQSRLKTFGLIACCLLVCLETSLRSAHGECGHYLQSAAPVQVLWKLTSRDAHRILQTEPRWADSYSGIGDPLLTDRLTAQHNRLRQPLRTDCPACQKSPVLPTLPVLFTAQTAPDACTTSDLHQLVRITGPAAMFDDSTSVAEIRRPTGRLERPPRYAA